MDTTTIDGFFDELEKISGIGGIGRKILNRMANMGGRGETIGLGILALPSIDNMIAKTRASAAGYKHPSEHTLNKFRMVKEKYHDAIETGGLGLLAAPYVAKRITTGHWGH